MENCRQGEFEARLGKLATLFKEKLTKDLLDIYWATLKDLDFNDYCMACSELAKSNIFFPKPAEFRERVVVSLKTRAQLAYGKVQRGASKFGGDRTVIFDDPVIHAVIVNLGGWINYCKLLKDEVVWWRKDFEERYVNFTPLVHSGALRLVKRLPGLYEGKNVSDHLKRPVFIGDMEKAKAWALDGEDEVKALEAVDYGKGAVEVKNILKNLGGRGDDT